MQTVNVALQAELDKGQVNPIILVDVYEFYDYDYVPGVNGFDPTAATEKFAAQEITWNGLAYRREVTSRGDISKNMGEKTNSVSLSFSNISRYLATWAQTEPIEGKFLVIRCVSPTVITDSIVLFVGRCDKPSDIDKQSFTLTARQDFGNINQTLPPRFFTAEDPEGRLPSDPLYEGINLIAVNGTNTIQTAPGQGSTWLFGIVGKIFGIGKKKPQHATMQWSSTDNTPYGNPIPEIFGRCQMAGIPFAWADKGTHVGALEAFSAGPIQAIQNIKTRTEGFSDPICSFANPPAPAVIHLGDPGGTGTNTGNTCQADLGSGQVFSHLAYVEGAFAGPVVNGVVQSLGIDTAEEPPLLTAIVLGRKIPVRNSSGVYGAAAWSNNPVDISRFILTDPKWVNIDSAFMEDPVLHQTGLHCDQPILDNTGSQIIVIQGPDSTLAGVTFTRYLSSGLYTPRYFRFHELGDLAIVPELADGPYIGIDIGDPVPDPGIPSDPTFQTQKPLIKRYTFNAPITEEVRAVDFLYKTVFPSAKLYMRVNKYGRYEIRSEKPSDSTRLRTATAVAATSIPVMDVTPWKTGPDLLQGFVLLGLGLVTSEARKPSAAVFSTSGNSITLTSSGSGITATASGATLSGGSTTVQASGTVTISGTPNAGDSVTVTIDGIATVYALNADDTTGTTAAMIAAYINANQRLNKYIVAVWVSSSPTVVTIRCLHGALTVPALLYAHAIAIADPTTAPTVVAAAGGTLAAGTYLVAYADVTASGSTVLTSTASVVVTANQKINLSSLPALVGTSRDFYVSEKAGSTNLRFSVNRTNNSNFSITDVPLPGAALPPSYNTTSEEMIRLAGVFATNSQDVLPAWNPSRAVVLNDFYLPDVLNGHKYKVTTAGTTGTSPPVWPLTSGGTVASGTSVFTEFGSTVLGQTGLTRANIKKDSFKWPKGSTQSSVNQCKISYRDSKNDFALTPLRINDPVHQAQVKKIYPMEIDGSGIDNFNQSQRIGNWALSKNREGDHFHAFGAGPAWLVLEEGDVIACSDDSGGLINVVTRIEDLRITKEHDVIINQSRLYSTLMFSDDVGSHRIPVASNLRFVATKNSIVEFLDTPAIRDGDAIQPGFKVSVSHALTDEGDWKGWALWADFGDGYTFLAEGDVAATIGEATTTLGTIGDISVFDPSSLTFTFDFVDAGLAFEDMTQLELEANPYRNLFLYGDEYIQAGTIVDNGARSFTISNLLRGRFETDGAELTHSALERVVWINGAEVFVPMQVDKVNLPFNYKLVTTNQDVADATPVSFTWIGNNVRPEKMSEILLAVDDSNDWFIQGTGHPGHLIPASYACEVWLDHSRNDPAKRIAVLPMETFVTVAALFELAGASTSYEIEPDGKTPVFVPVSYSDKNNLIADTSPSNHTFVRSLQWVRGVGARIDITADISRDGAGVANPYASTFSNEFGLVPADETTTPNFNDAPFVITWSANATPADPNDHYVRVYSYGTKIYEAYAAAAGQEGHVVEHETFTIMLVGNEFRAYRNWAPGKKPLAIGINRNEYPYKVYMEASGGSDILNCMIQPAGLNVASTIYSSAQQVADFGFVQSELFLRLYQVARFEGIGNPVDV